ncbi:hypothetical protein R1flu_004588 [Riccia fluitans]|uniref:AP2/ERF domain-containing protein n=1 Tax=Riccia fluitans TaxID=41844 RepID=A0ABD1YQR6_9MARC
MPNSWSGYEMQLGRRTLEIDVLDHGSMSCGPTPTAYKGVTFYKRTGRWEANIWYEGKQHYLGASSTAIEAARAYDKALLFTRPVTRYDELNFPIRDYEEDIEKVGINPSIGVRS